MPSNALPLDTMLIPLHKGALLVSRSHATFCPVPSGLVSEIQDVIDGKVALVDLRSSLLDTLHRHGFFSPPREPEPVQPILRFQLTNECNLACEYCCTDSGRARPNELRESEWIHLVDAGIGFHDSPLSFALLGGEPLLVPFALDLAQYILSRGRSVTVHTNGIPLADSQTAKRAAALIQQGMTVRVSLAGPTASSCDRLSGGARFESVILGLQNLAEFGERVSLDMMLFPETAVETANHFHMFRQRLPRGTRVSFGIAYCGGREAGRHMFASRTHLEAAMDRIALESGAGIPAPACSPVAPRREACHCAFGNDMHVRSDGMLFNCFKMEEPLGSVRMEPLERVWSRARQQCRTAPTLPTCASCQLSTLCGGGCRSENALYTGDGDRPLCGPWRKQIIAEMLAKEHIGVLEWPTRYLINEARSLNLEVPESATPTLGTIRDARENKGQHDV